MSESVYLTIEDAAKRAKVSRNTLKKWMKEGLPHIVMSRRLVRIHLIDFDEWMLGRLVKNEVSSRDVDRSSLDNVLSHVTEKTTWGRS